MTPERFLAIAANYARLRIALVGDFCLDRYLEIDPARAETSIETGLTVHNVVGVRSQPGGAGTILNNLAALGIGAIHIVGFCGDDGEGFELRRELAKRPGVRLDHFLTTPLRRTFTYCKPLVMEPGRPPVELQRLDSKNWTPTPGEVEAPLLAGFARLADEVDAIIVLDQVDVAETGVVTSRMRAAIGDLAKRRPTLPILADSRRGLSDWPSVVYKMNAAELASMTGAAAEQEVASIGRRALELAKRCGRDVFITLSERGLLGATPQGRVEHVEALPVRGPIDIVGAGDSVTANLTAALAAQADLREVLEIAAVASSLVIHQLGTTGTASVDQIATLFERMK